MALITLRVMKLFDSKSFNLLKQYCLRVIDAWVYKTRPSHLGGQYVVNSNDICYLLNICHFYIMTVFETDNFNGFVVDNLVGK